MSLLNKKQLLSRDEFQVEKVEFDDGGHVFVREMSGRQKDQFEQSIVEIFTNEDGKTDYKQNFEDYRAKLAVCTLCDADGNLLLEWQDYPTLSENMGAKKLSKISDKASTLNDMSKKDRDTLAKNLKRGQSDDSTSDSAAN